MTELQRIELARAIDGLMFNAQMATRCDLRGEFRAEGVHIAKMEAYSRTIRAFGVPLGNDTWG
jgi:hypothetical protein